MNQLSQRVDVQSPDDLAAFRRGDPEAFRDLMKRFSPYLLAVARSYAGDPDEATDLVQAAWTRTFERRTAFDGRGSLLGWILAICRREALMHLRRKRARVSAEASFSAGELADGDGVADEPRNFDEGRSVFVALADLPERQRDAVVLRLIDGRSTRETASIMGCAEGTVKALLHQGVTHLRSTLETRNGP